MAKALDSLVAHQDMELGMALRPISASSRARTILTFLLDELKVGSIKRSLAGMTLRIPEQVPMSNKSSWVLKQRVCGTNKGSLNQLTQCVLTSSWPRRKTIRWAWSLLTMATPNLPQDVKWHEEMVCSKESTCSSWNSVGLKSVIFSDDQLTSLYMSHWSWWWHMPSLTNSLSRMTWRINRSEKQFSSHALFTTFCLSSFQFLLSWKSHVMERSQRSNPLFLSKMYKNSSVKQTLPWKN